MTDDGRGGKLCLSLRRRKNSGNPFTVNAANFAKGLIHGYVPWTYAGFAVYISREMLFLCMVQIKTRTWA